MNKIDVRKLDSSARKQLRETVIQLHKAGHSQIQICTDLGLRPATVNDWVQRYRTAGRQGLVDKKTGRRSGTGRSLTPKQELRIQRDIVDKTPDQHKLPFALWNAEAVKRFIQQSFGVALSVRAVRVYLHRWGFSPQRPIKRAYE